MATLTTLTFAADGVGRFVSSAVQLNNRVASVAVALSAAGSIAEGVQYECDFVPANEGLISETPNFDMFIGELKSKGLSEIEIEIETIRKNVQL